MITKCFLSFEQRNCRKDCQMLLFSATYDQNVMKFAQAIVPNPVTIRLRREEESLDNIKQYFINCSDQQDKFEALSNIYGSISIGQTMIFCHVSCEKISISRIPSFHIHISNNNKGLHDYRHPNFLMVYCFMDPKGNSCKWLYVLNGTRLNVFIAIVASVLK